MSSEIFTSQNLLAETLNDLINKDGKLTPASLARKLGIPANKITRILNGDVTDPKASTLLQIANCFGITIEQLMGLEPIKREGLENFNASQVLPVFDINNIGHSKPKDWYRWMENDLEGNYFAISVDTDLYDPTFPKHSILIVNPDLPPEDRAFVLVKKKNSPNYTSIKKYVLDGDQVYLYPVNPQLAIEIYDDTLYNICGVVLEVHQRLTPKK